MEIYFLIEEYFTKTYYTPYILVLIYFSFIVCFNLIPPVSVIGSLKEFTLLQFLTVGSVTDLPFFPSHLPV